MVADDLAHGAALGHAPQLVAQLVAPSGDGGEDLVVGQGREDVLDLLVDGGHEQGQGLVARGLGGEVRVGDVRAQHRVHLPHHRAEVAQPRGEAVGGARAQLVEGQVPAVGRAGEEALGHAEGGVEQVAGELVPAQQVGHVVEAVAGQELQHLQLRVLPRLQVAEDLEDHGVVDDHRGVGLLGAEHAHRRAGRPGRGRAAIQWKATSPATSSMRVPSARRRARAAPRAGSARAS